MTDIAQRASFERRRGYLDQLAARLDGFDREIALSATGVPMLVVTNPQVPALCEHVLCCHDVDGTLAYVWPWGKRIAPAADTRAAALAVARVLGC